MPQPRPTQLEGITDLTVFADIKPGLIDGIFDSRTYTWRLQRVLELLDAARRASREAEVLPNPFIDGVSRLRGVHFFRFAILPPGDRLFLNVSFDGGWEPYMRHIWGPLGTMLDLIFCHCLTYRLAAATSFDDYMRWVREHEVPSQFFYADSGGSVADRAYLNRLEWLQRSAGDRPGADLRAAQLALQPPRPPQPTATAVNAALRSLKGLYGLTQFFGLPAPAPEGSVPDDDAWVLLRFAQDYLPDLRNWFAQGLFDPGQQFDVLRARFERERLWLMKPRWSRPRKQDPAALLDLSRLQAGILHSPRAPAGRFGRGALVLARVSDPAAARKWLIEGAAAVPAPAGHRIGDGRSFDLSDKEVLCTVAITYPGLQALGVHEKHLDALAAEFRQGMEARAGLLGDVRINHPQQWNRPRAWPAEASARPAPIDLALVHLVIQLRTAEADGEQEDDRSRLLPRLEQWITGLLPPKAIEVLAVEPGWSKPGSAQEPAPRDHFDYADGISQPTLTPSAGRLFWDDAVKTGEVLLGRVNDRGDGPLERPGAEPQPATPAWLDLGTFLVVRKIRQFVGRFEGIVDKAAGALWAARSAPSIDAARELVRAKLMGRASDGSPLLAQRGPGANDFDYRHDADGAQCPFASHVRRANPRDVSSGERPPRIVRRGMGYGPLYARQVPPGPDTGERGVLFMAYNASIAEQFEVIQRWLVGGNSSGVSSSQSDPFVGVARVGEPAVFRCSHADQVIRVDLGDQPVCKLEWGLYAFVPSMVLLRSLDKMVWGPDQPVPGKKPVAAQASKQALKKRVKDEFEDELSRRQKRWQQVRDDHNGVEGVGPTVMVGSYRAVMQVLQDRGSHFSARGYAERMKATLGPSPFGQDDEGTTPGHERAFVGAVKRSIAAAVSEEGAYASAYRIVETRLQEQLAGARALGLPGAGIDIIELGTDLIAKLCEAWFGVAYGIGAGLAEAGGIAPQNEPVRCPGHFLSVARNVFSAWPNDKVEALAQLQGEALKAAVAGWVSAAAGARAAAPLMKKVLEAMDSAPDGKGISREERNGTVANVMLGLPATLLGSWGKLLLAWVAGRDLWRLQHALSLRAGPAAHAHARAVLREPLIRTLAVDPVADGIWRTVARPHDFHGVKVAAGDIVWLGLGSALADGTGDLQTAEDLLFGGALPPESERYAPHACPGRDLAVGTLLGALAALLMAGQWAPTASPTTLSLQPPLS
jgi:Dyp-type peroxidase family